MELQAQSSLNLQVTKEDLIDILIDEQLTMLEKKRDAIQAELKIYQDKNKVITDKKTSALEARLRKLCPVPAKKDEFSLSYRRGYRSSNVSFCFENYTVNLLGTFDCEVVYSQAENNLMKENNKQITRINESYQMIQQDIQTLNGNNKRVKAKMLRNFLTGTKEGQAILQTLDTTPKQALVGYGR